MATTLTPYWDSFYAADHPDLNTPSSFAEACAEYLDSSSTVFEIGCGNGRDSLFFASMGMRVHASDASDVAIERLHEHSRRSTWRHQPRWIARSMEQLDDRHAGELDAVYMRFVLHAVPADTASHGLAWAARNLKRDGLL